VVGAASQTPFSKLKLASEVVHSWARPHSPLQLQTTAPLHWPVAELQFSPNGHWSIVRQLLHNQSLVSQNWLLQLSLVMHCLQVPLLGSHKSPAGQSAGVRHSLQIPTDRSHMGGKFAVTHWAEEVHCLQLPVVVLQCGTDWIGGVPCCPSQSVSDWHQKQPLAPQLPLLGQSEFAAQMAWDWAPGQITKLPVVPS